MNFKSRLVILSTISILTLLVNLAFPVTALADDGTPPVATEEPAVTDEPAEPVESQEPQPESVSEILEQVPEDTEVVVLDEEGEVLPLVSEEAAVILVSGDPQWCPDGVTPEVGMGCTSSHTTFADLLTELGGGGYSGPGTIYVADDYDYTLEPGDVTIDGSVLTTLAGSNLFVQGGWLFGTGGVGSNTNLGNLSFSIFNWTGDVAFHDFDIDGSQDGLYIQTDGDVDLNELLVQNTDDSTGIYIEAGGDVTAHEVEAYNNYLEGMVVDAGGDVEIEESSFSGNGTEGYTYSFTSGNNTYFDDYGSSGLYIDNSSNGGNVTLNDVFAEGNGLHGAEIDSEGDVEVYDSYFNENGWYGYYTYSIFDDGDVYSETTSSGGGSGLYVDTEGDIYIEDVTANDNGYYGAELYSDDGDVSVFSSYFGDGDCDCDGEGNGGFGSLDYEIDLGGPSDSGYDSSFYFDYHAGGGFIIDAEGDVSIGEVYAISNAGDGGEIESDNGEVNIEVSVFADNGWSSGIFCEEGDNCFGYDELYYGLGMFCESVEIGPLMMDPCETEFEVYAPNFELEMHDDSDDDSESQGYMIEQDGGIGLYVDSEEDISLEEVGVYENSGTGADLYSDDSDIYIEDSQFNGNGFLDYSYYGEYLSVDYYDDHDHFSYSGGFAGGYSDGLVAYSDGDITLYEVFVSTNGGNGAYLDAEGSINVEDAVFVGNGQDELCVFFLCEIMGEMPASSFYVEFGYSSDYYWDEDVTTNETFGLYGEVGTGSGLDAEADGNITLNDVTAAVNGGNGAALYTDSNAVINESGFYGNGAGMQGYLYLVAEVEATECPLCFEDFEPIHVEGYSGNSSGLSVYAEGDITLDHVEAEGNSLHGAELYSDASDSVMVTDSAFNGNGGGYSSWMYYDANDEEESYGEQYGSGLYIESQGAVTLTNVDAIGNDNNGAEIYSNNGPVIISCGQYSGNYEYGVYVEDASSLTLNGPVLTGNGSGEYFFGGTVILTDDCTTPESPKSDTTIIPVTGGTQITCEGITTDTVTVMLPNGDFVVLACPINQFAVVDQTFEGALPGPLGSDQHFVSALTALVIRDGQAVSELEEPMVVSFLIPEGTKPEDLTILFWNGTEWIELEGHVSEDGLHFDATTSLLGTFVLVRK
jgi:hypothetical protein